MPSGRGQMALQVIDGNKANRIPIEKNNDGDIILNVLAANWLGVHFPFEVIQAADKMIE